MSADYFIMFGILFALCCVVRLTIWWNFQIYPHVPPSKPYSGPVTFINAPSLSDRLQQVRQDCLAHAREQSPSFKKSILVKSRREELAPWLFPDQLRRAKHRRMITD